MIGLNQYKYVLFKNPNFIISIISKDSEVIHDLF
jgi:hypothetical protein